jgi:hypothetical protein
MIVPQMRADAAHWPARHHQHTGDLAFRSRFAIVMGCLGSWWRYEQRRFLLRELELGGEAVYRKELSS